MGSNLWTSHHYTRGIILQMAKKTSILTDVLWELHPAELRKASKEIMDVEICREVVKSLFVSYQRICKLVTAQFSLLPLKILVWSQVFTERRFKWPERSPGFFCKRYDSLYQGRWKSYGKFCTGLWADIKIRAKCSCRYSAQFSLLYWMQYCIEVTCSNTLVLCTVEKTELRREN